MCGRYNFDGDTVNLVEVIEDLKRKYDPDSVKTGESAPTDADALLGLGLEPASLVSEYQRFSWRNSRRIFCREN